MKDIINSAVEKYRDLILEADKGNDQNETKTEKDENLDDFHTFFIIFHFNHLEVKRDHELIKLCFHVISPVT